jgi:predicted RNA binding protein YcfA (HicA-like mRNA interferase family)
MKRYKVSEILRMLKDDGWYLVVIEGSHRQFKHPTKKGRVTLNGKPSKVLDQELLNNIFKQAGWR